MRKAAQIALLASLFFAGATADSYGNSHTVSSIARAAASHQKHLTHLMKREEGGDPTPEQVCKFIGDKCKANEKHHEEPQDEGETERRQDEPDMCNEEACLGWFETHHCFIPCAKGCVEKHRSEKDAEAAVDKCIEGTCKNCQDGERRRVAALIRAAREEGYQEGREEARRTMTRKRAVARAIVRDEEGGEPPKEHKDKEGGDDLPSPDEMCDFVQEECKGGKGGKEEGGEGGEEEGGEEPAAEERIKHEELCDKKKCVEWFKGHKCFYPCVDQCISEHGQKKEADELIPKCVDEKCLVCENSAPAARRRHIRRQLKKHY